MSQEPTDVRVRRAPKFGRFAIIGGALGALGTFIATNLFPSDPAIGFWALFAYFSLYGVTAGVALGLVLALVLDRILSRRARVATATREDVRDPLPDSGIPAAGEADAADEAPGPTTAP